MNKLLLVGRATQKPELTIASSGQAYTKLTIAVDDRGNEKKPVDFIDIKAFGKVADILNKFVEKGQMLAIEAKVKQNVYEKEDGTKNYTNDFILQEFEFVGATPKAEAEAPKAEAEAPKDEKENLPW